MRLIVQKYGGTSVGTPERICNVAKRLIETQRQGCHVVAVISAIAGATDNLVKLAHEVSPHPTERELDILLSTGEHTATALTAMALAGALNADACQIFTDVDGVFTCDPQIVKEAKKLDEIAYDELLEMASGGAKVMQSRAMEFAKKFGVEFEVRSSLNKSRGTF